jgi:hypothetical protein
MKAIRKERVRMTMIPRSLKERVKRKDKNQPSYPQKAQFALLAKEEATKAEGQWLVLYRMKRSILRFSAMRMML